MRLIGGEKNKVTVLIAFMFYSLTSLATVDYLVVNHITNEMYWADVDNKPGWIGWETIPDGIISEKQIEYLEKGYSITNFPLKIELVLAVAICVLAYVIRKWFLELLKRNQSLTLIVLLSFTLILSINSCKELNVESEEIFASSLDREEKSLDSLILSTCDCSDENFDYLLCDTTFLSNSSMLYWHYECDSVAYCYENKDSVNIIKSGFIFGLTSSIGLSFIKEYEDYLFFIDEHISGCCAPPDLVFLNKTDASEIERVSSKLYVFANYEKNYILYFKNGSLKNLMFKDLRKNKKQQFSLKGLDVKKAVNQIRPIHLNELFTINDNEQDYLEIEFRTTPTTVEKLNLKIK